MFFRACHHYQFQFCSVSPFSYVFSIFRAASLLIFHCYQYTRLRNHFCLFVHDFGLYLPSTPLSLPLLLYTICGAYVFIIFIFVFYVLIRMPIFLLEILFTLASVLTTLLLTIIATPPVPLPTEFSLSAFWGNLVICAFYFNSFCIMCISNTDKDSFSLVHYISFFYCLIISKVIHIHGYGSGVSFTIFRTNFPS